MKSVLESKQWLTVAKPGRMFLALALALPAALALAGDPDPQALRERADALERKARQLKEEGEHDKAQATMRQAEELRAVVRKAREPQPDRPADRPRPEEVRRQIQELRAAGKAQEAMELQRRLQETEPRRATPGPGAFSPPGPQRERARQREGMQIAPRGPDALPGGQIDPAQRRRHLEIAIDNLHAAGLHEVAERIALRMEATPRHRPDLPDGPRFQGLRPGGMPAAELQRLRAEVQELRQAVSELRTRLERGEGAR